MADILVQTIFGWPAIILSIAVSVAGILKKWSWMLVLGGVLCAPFAVYVSGYPFFHYTTLLLPLFLFGAAWAVHAKRKVLAWALLLPLVSVSVILAIIVLSQTG
jgi:peptidoglycan/LPS O-acetylase OafA/YrhL